MQGKKESDKKMFYRALLAAAFSLPLIVVFGTMLNLMGTPYLIVVAICVLIFLAALGIIIKAEATKVPADLNKNPKAMLRLAFFAILAFFVFLIIMSYFGPTGGGLEGVAGFMQGAWEKKEFLSSLLGWFLTFMGFGCAIAAFLAGISDYLRERWVNLFLAAFVVSLALAVIFVALTPDWLLTLASLALSAITFLWSRGKQREQAKAES